MPRLEPGSTGAAGEWPRGLAGVAVLVLIWAATGCDSASFAPPAPGEPDRVDLGASPKLFTPPASSDALLPAPAGAKAIALILARHDPEDAEMLKSGARTQAGYDRVKLNITMLGDHDLPAQQAGLVQDALARSPLALILEPADTQDKHLAGAVAEAQRQGVPVLFLYRSLAPSRVGSQASAAGEPTALTSALQESAAKNAAPTHSASAPKPPILVSAPSFASSAEQLVESAMRNAKNGGLDPKRGAIVVVNTVSDAFASERTSAIREALKKAGITSVEEIRFAYTADRADKTLSARLKTNTKAVLVFSVDSQCLSAIRQMASQPELEERPFVVAGFVSDDLLAPYTQTGAIAAIAEFNSTRLIRKAITAAASITQGKEVPERIDMPVRFHDSPPRSGKSIFHGPASGIPTRKDN